MATSEPNDRELLRIYDDAGHETFPARANAPDGFDGMTYRTLKANYHSLGLRAVWLAGRQSPDADTEES